MHRDAPTAVHDEKPAGGQEEAAAQLSPFHDVPSGHRTTTVVDADSTPAVAANAYVLDGSTRVHDTDNEHADAEAVHTFGSPSTTSVVRDGTKLNDPVSVNGTFDVAGFGTATNDNDGDDEETQFPWPSQTPLIGGVHDWLPPKYATPHPTLTEQVASQHSSSPFPAGHADHELQSLHDVPATD